MFHVGQKVVCVDPSWGCPTGHPLQLQYCPNLPSKGSVYIVRSIQSIVAVRIHGATAFIRLCEILNPAPSGTEPYFDAHKYRAFIERKTDISIFTAMLTPSKVNA